MDCDIVLVGLNHRTAAVDVRERFALVKYTDPGTWALPLGGAIHESLILSTCNRVELLAMGKGDLAGQMLNSWAGVRNAKVEDLERYVYTYKNEEAVRHLFRVASSLDSMILGEPQILGQLKAAYRKASACHATGVILNHLLHKAFSVAKRVRTETAVASSAVSISFAAVELAKRIFGTMQGHKAMLIGAGEMAELAATHLMQNGVDEIIVANRTFAHAEELASFYHGRAVPFEDFARHLLDVDIVITSTGSQDPIIHARDIRTVLKNRANRPMFFIDIAVPRDVDPDVNGLDNVYLYDIDDLKEVVQENMAGAVSRPKKLIKSSTTRYMSSQTGSADWTCSLPSRNSSTAVIWPARKKSPVPCAGSAPRIRPPGMPSWPWPRLCRRNSCTSRSPTSRKATRPSTAAASSPFRISSISTDTAPAASTLSRTGKTPGPRPKRKETERKTGTSPLRASAVLPGRRANMRQYTVTELSEKDIETIETALREKKLQASIDHLFWIPVPDDLLTPLQKEHATTCGPHVMALEVMRSSLNLEFLVRARNKIRCDCITYADDRLMLAMIHRVNDFLSGLGISV